MKARLIKDDSQRLVLLCSDGTLIEANDLVLYDLLTDFEHAKTLFIDGEKFWNEEYPDMLQYPGDTIAYIADDNSLVLYDFAPFAGLLNVKIETRDYISSTEYAKRHNKSTEIIKVFCRQGRIPGAEKIGRNWMIPSNAPYPVEPARQRDGVRGPRSKQSSNLPITTVTTQIYSAASAEKAPAARKTTKRQAMKDKER